MGSQEGPNPLSWTAKLSVIWLLAKRVAVKQPIVLLLNFIARWVSKKVDIKKNSSGSRRN